MGNMRRATNLFHTGWLWWLVRLALSGGLLWLIFRLIDFDDFWRTLQNVDGDWLAAGMAAFFPGQLLAAYRWDVLLRRMQRDLSYRSVLQHNLRGQFAALFLPGQISGDLVRTASVMKGQSGKAGLAISVIIDKVLLLAAIAAIGISGGLASATLSGIAGLNLIFAAILLAALVAIFVLCRYRGARIQQLISRARRFMPAVLCGYLRRLDAVIHVPPLSYSTIGWLLALALAVQAVNIIGSFCIARAMHIRLEPVDWAALTSVVALIQVLPVSLGGLGVREGAVASILLLYGVPVAQSTAYSLVGFVLVASLAAAAWFAMESVHWWSKR